jgi:hypothetical protein
MAAKEGKGDVKEPSQLSETIDLLKRYVQQETVGPLKVLLKGVLKGLVGGFLLAIGLVILVLGVLRVLQAETGTTFHGRLSWLPYVCALFAALILVGLVVGAAVRGGSKGKAK